MNTSPLARILSLAVLAAALGAAHAQSAAPADQAAAPSATANETANSWLVAIDGAASSDGMLTLTVTPWDIGPVTVSVAAKQGESANMIALKFRDAFRAALDQNTFRVDLKGKDTIRVLAKHGDHQFRVDATETAASGVNIDLKKEK
jgi:hypothetical protein